MSRKFEVPNERRASLALESGASLVELEHDYVPEPEPDPWQRILPLVEARWLILLAVFMASIVTFAASKLFLVSWYRATAILHPLEENLTGSRWLGMGFGGPAAGASVLQQLTGGGGQSEEAWEYISVLKSYTFVNTLIDQQHLQAMLAAYGKGKQTPWRQYEEMLDHFDATYEIKSGNIKLNFDDPNPADARRVLGHFIDRLREKLRSQQVEESKAAADSLQEEAARTSDSLLQTKLYEMVAQQRQRLVVARVQADFAFKVIDGPVVPDKPYWPRSTLNALVAGFLAFLTMAFIILAREYRIRCSRAQARPKDSADGDARHAARPNRA